MSGSLNTSLEPRLLETALSEQPLQLLQRRTCVPLCKGRSTTENLSKGLDQMISRGPFNPYNSVIHLEVHLHWSNRSQELIVSAISKSEGKALYSIASTNSELI